MNFKCRTKKIINICPRSKDKIIRLTGLYGILDMYIQNRKEFTIHGDLVTLSELIAAKNTIILIIQLYFYIKYQYLVENHSEKLKIYYDFYEVLAREMLKEGFNNFDHLPINKREFFYVANFKCS